MALCPCGYKEYSHCCGLYHNGTKIPATPQQLMRSRYSAYAMANIDYIQRTMLGKPLLDFNMAEVRIWAKNVAWLGLQVVTEKLSTPDLGHVEFIARFIEAGKQRQIHEVSEFHRIQGKWFYVDGKSPDNPSKENRKKIGRNSLCPCGSGKKYKNCHGK